MRANSHQNLKTLHPAVAPHSKSALHTVFETMEEESRSIDETYTPLPLELQVDESTGTWQILNYEAVTQDLRTQGYTHIPDIIQDRLNDIVHQVYSVLCQEESDRMTRVLASRQRFRSTIRPIPYNKLDNSDKKQCRCSICLEDFRSNKRRMVVNPCDCCVFHSTCLKAWARMSHDSITCPNCKKMF